MKITVHVTEEHIEHGARCQSDCCPIARALMEQHPPAKGLRWRVGMGLARIVSKREIRETYFLPASARFFIGAFDQQRGVGPFTFTLEKQP